MLQTGVLDLTRFGVARRRLMYDFQFYALPSPILHQLHPAVVLTVFIALCLNGCTNINAFFLLLFLLVGKDILVCVVSCICCRQCGYTLSL